MDNIFNKFKNLEAMKYFDRPDDYALSANLLTKKYNMIRNMSHEYMATQKWDGYWMMFIKGEHGDIYIRGRNKTKAGIYEDYAPKVPHLVEEMQGWPDNTVILGEICWDDMSKVATDVGVILRCLPAKAVERQKTKKLSVKCFDALCINGYDIMNYGYSDRFEGLMSLSHRVNHNYFSVTEAYYDEDILVFADSIISRGGEGCVIQKKDHPYEPGKRTAWQTLKLKQKLPVANYKVLGFLEPKREYEGEDPAHWPYQLVINADPEYSCLVDLHDTTAEQVALENPSMVRMIPVTRPYFMGWKVGVTIELPNGQTCDVASGLTDADREWCTTDEAQSLLEEGKLYAVVSAMQEATLGRLRHPVFKGWEYDKDSAI